MRWLIKSAQIVDPGGKHHGRKRDLLIDDGVITSIKTSIQDENAESIVLKNLHLSPGWIDAKANFRDPGDEDKEGLINGLDAAASGGFTHVVLMPGTNPVIDNKGQVEYLLRRSDDHVVRALPTGNISKGSEGKQLAELFDMHKSGAIAFTEDGPVAKGELMRRALEYSRTFGGVVCSLPQEESISNNGVMHEGVTSTMNGLKGIPEMVETIRLNRDIALLRYTGGRLHVMLISCAESVRIIKEAKKEGLNITCGVSAHHLFFNDESLSNFDANLKVHPPIRAEEDRKALIKGLQDGTIDVVCSDHKPEDVEHKKLEFELANFGIGAIEQTFSAALNHLELDLLISKLTTGPREVFNLREQHIEEGAEADLTLFDPHSEYTVDKASLMSLAWNNPYEKLKLTGIVHGIILGDRAVLR
ncbi:MAG: dihydroorotase [Flavobacteriales bacterium]|jgi:dihydroorotase